MITVAVSISVIKDPAELLEHERGWNSFVSKYSENPILLSGFIVKLMELSVSRGWTPLVLVIRKDKKIIGIAPLMTRKRLGVRIVRFLPRSWFSPDLVADDQYRGICIAHTVNLLFENLHCQILDLTLPAESPNLRVLKQTSEGEIRFRAKRGRWADMAHSIIPVKTAWDEFTRTRGYNFRRRFRRLEKKLDQAGPWSVISIENADSASDILDQILDVEKKSWKQATRARKGAEIDQDLSVLWEGSQRTARTEPDFKWSVWFLKLNDRALAYTFVLQYKKAAFIVKTSYKEPYKKFYPGIYVNNSAIRELFNSRQVRKIDWLTDLPFHRNWTSICLPRVRVTMSRQGVFLTIMAYVSASPYTRNVLAVTQDLLTEKAPFIGGLIDLFVPG